MPEFIFLPPHTAVTRSYAVRLARDVTAINVYVAEDDNEVRRVLPRADAAFGMLPPHLLPFAAKLRWLHSRQIAPPLGYFYPELIAHPMMVTNTRDVYNDHIGAHILAFVLTMSRDILYYHRQQQLRCWAPKSLNADVVALPEATALIVGVGGIGAEAGRLLAAFGTRVLGVDARREDLPPGFEKIEGARSLDNLLPEADFVILTLPHTPATEFLMDTRRFALMKPNAFFINVGRGMTTRTQALVEALRSGHLAGAALDVFEEEPLPSDNPLWAMKNVLITPHMAGFGPHVDERRYQILRDNCIAFCAQKPLRNVVDKRVGF
jgi:phosphoglycerate dehydrogenase-like enzyme